MKRGLIAALLLLCSARIDAQTFQTISGSGVGGAITATFQDDYRVWEKIRLNFNTLNTYFKSGTGSPEGVVTGTVGALYFRTNGSTNTTLYVKESGSGNTGWVAHGAATLSTTGSPVTSSLAIFSGVNTLTSSNLTGDVTTSGTVATTITAGVVTLAKMANIATDRLIGRDTTGTGVPEALTVGGGIEFTGSGGIQTSAFTGDVTKSAGGTALTVAADAVTYDKLANLAATRLLGRGTAGGTGDPEPITLGAGLSMAGTVLSSVVTGSNGGDVVGPASSTDDRIATFDGVTGKLLQDGGQTIAEVIAAAGATPLMPQGRLTLTTGTPFMTSNVTGATTIYYTPTTGAYVPIYNGSIFVNTQFTERSQTTTDTTKSPAAVGTYSNYDIFVWNDSGTVRATRGPAWTQAQTFTVTIASPGVFTLTGHGFYEGMPVVFTTTGALPTGLTAGTTYFVIAAGLTANAFEVAATVGGTAINTSGSQSGTHTATQNTTVRGTGAGTTELQYVNGVLTNANAVTNGPAANRGTYVGSIRTNGSSTVDMIFGGVGAAGGESTVLGVWNMYNRVSGSFVNFDTTDSWTYTLTSFRIKNGNVNNRIQYLVGYRGDSILATANMTGGPSVNNDISSAIGADSMTGPAIGSATSQMRVGAGTNVSTFPTYSAIAPLGFHYVAPLEVTGAASGTTTWFGDGGGTSTYTAARMITNY